MGSVPLVNPLRFSNSVESLLEIKFVPDKMETLQFLKVRLIPRVCWFLNTSLISFKFGWDLSPDLTHLLVATIICLIFSCLDRTILWPKLDSDAAQTFRYLLLLLFTPRYYVVIVVGVLVLIDDMANMTRDQKIVLEEVESKRRELRISVECRM